MNGNHGDFKFQTRNFDNPHLCSVCNWLEIAARFICLRGSSIFDKQLAVCYNTKTKSVCNVTSSLATTAMRLLSNKVYGLTDKELKLFSRHSIRVGACCALFAQGFSPDFIKRCLRWKSDSWQTYVRDLLVIAQNTMLLYQKLIQILTFNVTTQCLYS